MRSVRYSSIVSGTSNTIGVIEASDLLAVTWTRPDDPVLKHKTDTRLVPFFAGLRDDGFLAGFLDVNVRKVLSDNDPEAILRRFRIDTPTPNTLQYARPHHD
jgi:hypothetical protein